MGKKIFRFNSFLLLTILLPYRVIWAVDYSYTNSLECTDKRLDLPPEVASKIPVQDQDGTKFCGAYTASQLIDSWITANASPAALTSPLALAIEFSAAKNLQEFAPIPVLDLMESSQSLNSCSYDVVKDHFNSRRSADFKLDLVSNFNQAKIAPEKKEQSVSTVLSCVLNSTGNSRIQIDQIRKYMNENTNVKFTNKIIEELCKGYRKPLANVPTIDKYKSLDIKDQFIAMNKFKDVINKRLDMTKAQPLGISYCRTVLKQRDFIGVSDGGKLDDNTCNEVHASVIVGRRLLKYKLSNGTIGSICQYLVRDSFGSSCNRYDSYEKDSLPDSKGEKPKVCENGQVWIDEDSLLRNTSELFHLKDR